MKSNPWTVERIDLLRKLWDADLTGSQIAKELGAVTRCAVIGKARRLGLQPRPERANGGRGARRCVDPVILEARRLRQIHAQRARRAAERGMPVPTVAPVAMFVAPVFIMSRSVPFADLERGECKFIEGPAPELRSCGNTAPDGSSWCIHHQKIVFEKPERRSVGKQSAVWNGPPARRFSGRLETA